MASRWVRMCRITSSRSWGGSSRAARSSRSSESVTTPPSKTSGTGFSARTRSRSPRRMFGSSASRRSTRRLWQEKVDEGRHGRGVSAPLPRQEPHLDAGDVHLAKAQKLRVSFAEQCSTYDDCATFQVFSGGLSKSTAGVGARAHLKAISGPDQVHGTMIGQVEGEKWIVNIDKDESEICGCFREWLDAQPGRSCTATCAQDPTVVSVRYTPKAKVGSEIAGFTFHEGSPLHPFSISGFTAPGGPAQLKGVFAGWYLDVIALLKNAKFKNLSGEGLGTCPKNLQEIAENLDAFKKRLEAALDLDGVNFVFYNGLDFQLLPICAVQYKGIKVSEEIAAFNANGGVLSIASFKQDGPAQGAGVRAGWHLSLTETFERADNKTALGELTAAQVLEDPEQLLQLQDLTLMMEPANAAPEELFNGFGTDGWDNFTVHNNTAQFVFKSDGDGGDSSEGRWGVFAVVTDAKDPEPQAAVLEELAKLIPQATAQILGTTSSQVSVEPEDWDEARLRALCDRHGWEFEWMTEDGERQRRIEGASRARQAAAESAGTAQAESRTAWWRLDSMSRAFNGGDSRQLKRKIQAPQPIRTKS
ncbi:unnamed protein product [Effrenium voratum]|nr:unnamed protein product [Effrenium voratum]